MHLTAQNAMSTADALEQLNAVTNSGRGSSVCRSVVSELRRSDIEGAKIIAAVDFDKVRQYPEMAMLFKRVGLISHKLQ